MATALKSHHPYEAFYQLGLASLNDGTFLQFENENLRDSSFVQRRILKHLRIKKLMHEGQHQKAMILIRDLRNESGDHISLLCDQASLAYLMKNYSVWSSTTAEIDALLSQVESKLGQEALTKTLLLMAKFFEEQGLIRKSYTYLKRAEKNAHALTRTRIRANIIRLLSFHSISTELSEYYSELKQVSQSEPEFNTYAEFLHALILAEAKLFGPYSACENLAVLRAENKLTSEDVSLILFDLVQVLSLSGEDLPASLIQDLKDQSAYSNYEEKLQNLLLKTSDATHQWATWSSQMPLGNYLLLSSHLRQSLTTDQLAFFQRQLGLLTKSLPISEQRYWQQLIKTNLKTEILVMIDNPTRTITANENQMDFKTRRTLFDLAQLVFEEKKFSLIDCTRKVFNSEFNDSYYHRIRRLVKRINDEFTSRLLPPPLTCTRAEITLNQPYR